MVTYILLFVCQCLLWILSQRIKRPRLWLCLSLGILFFVSSFRAMNIGTDYSEYVSIYYHVAKGNAYDMEPGYVFMNRVMSLIIPHYCGLGIGVNLMLMIPLGFFIVKNVPEKYWNLCVMIFTANPYMFIQSSFNILRQSCAIGMILLATHFFIRKKWVRGVFFVLIAALFHKIAIVYLIVPIFFLFKITKQAWYIIISFSFAFSMLLGDKMFSLIASLLNFSGYLGYEASALNNPIYCGAIFVIAMLFASYRNKCVTTEAQKHFYDLYLFALCMLFFAVKNDMVYRTYLIFAFSSLPAVPLIWKRCGIGVRIGYMAYYTAFYVGYVLLFSLSNDTFYIPFKFCFG